MLINKEEKFLRGLIIVFNIVCLIFLTVAIILPDILTKSFKLLLITTAIVASIGLTGALFLSDKKQPHYTVFFSILSSFLNGLILGISSVVIIIY